MDTTAQTSYDEVPYPSAPRPQTHPDRLATLATLFGSSPPSVDSCRVLELGCADGANLIPMAYGLPEGEFVGVDLSARQITEGQVTVSALGFTNIDLRHGSISDVNAEWGQFDYIIAHGVFSWVPRPVQDKVLEICRSNLAANGVAYVSYNANPGWRWRGAVRDMMLYATQQMTEPGKRIEQARSFLGFLTDAVPTLIGSLPENQGYGLALAGVQEWTEQYSDSYLLHEFLEQENEPVYFYQFIERAARCGLQYLAEAEFRQLPTSSLPAKVSDSLRQLVKSRIDFEQYMDFLQNRSFRQTLLCHQDVPLARALQPQQVASLHVASSVFPETPEPDVRSTQVEKFLGLPGPDGAGLGFSTQHPLTKAVLLCLSEIWPRALAFDDLLAMARLRLGFELEAEHDAQDIHTLQNNLVGCFTLDLVELRVHVPRFVAQVSERPSVSPVALFQAENSTTVTNLRHQSISLDDDNVACHLLRYLDGSRDRADLMDVVAGLASQGVPEMQQNGVSAQDSDQAREMMAAVLDQRLRRLVNASLLIG